jgi:toxin-antitoxin system PIN domain toxin
VSVALLDVNVLLAMTWPENFHSIPAMRWYAKHRSEGWATCPPTEAGFVRLSAQPGIVGANVGMRQAMDAMDAHCKDPYHVFWPLDQSLVDLLPEIRNRLVGHQQLTDAILLDLAIRRGGRLVTLDRSVVRLLPPDSPHLSNIELISPE